MSARMPGISVVVASFRDPELLAACLDSLERAREAVPAPVVVARRGNGDDVRHLVEDRPWARLVPAPADADVARLRGAGMLAVGGGWIAVTEDHCVADPCWLEVLAGATEGPHQLLGGGMGNAQPGALNWAAYFSEYGFFSSARPEEVGHSLITGANVAYGPEVSERVGRWAADGMWEDVVHARLSGEGVTARFLPGARILQNTTYALGPFCRDRWEHGHDFARVRLRENPETSRLARLVTTPLLPWVLTLRVARAAAGEDRGAFLRALPITWTFLAAWSLGEAAGYLKGAADE